MAHVRQSWPDSGVGFQVKVLKTIRFVSFRPEGWPGFRRKVDSES